MILNLSKPEIFGVGILTGFVIAALPVTYYQEAWKKASAPYEASNVVYQGGETVMVWRYKEQQDGSVDICITQAGTDVPFATGRSDCWIAKAPK